MSHLERIKWMKRVAVLLTLVMVLGSAPVFAENVADDSFVTYSELGAELDADEALFTTESEDTEGNTNPDEDVNLDGQDKNEDASEDLLMDENVQSDEIEREETFAFSAGDGTTRNPYIISSVNELRNIRDMSANYRLGADIDFEGDYWIPACIEEEESFDVFTGTFDGAGFTISDFKLGYGSTITALFPNTEGATIKNVNAKNVSFEDYASSAGVFAGYAYETKILNCNVEKINTQEASNVGGIAGYVVDSEIQDCTVRAFYSEGSYYVGGIAGSIDNSTVENCTVSGITIADSFSEVGGIVGYAQESRIGGCTVNGTDISGYSNVGGLVGGFVASQIFDCEVKLESLAGQRDIGGLIGSVRSYGDTMINNCTVIFDNIYGEECLGGLIGSVSGEVEVDNCNTYFTSITGYRNIGGAFGSLYSESSAIKNCTVSFNLIQDDTESYYMPGSQMGGFVGETSYSNYVNCQVVQGSVSTGSYAGGFAGTGYNNTFKNCSANVSILETDNHDSYQYYMGGFGGSIGGSVFEQCIASGDVSAHSESGGFLGSSSSSQFINCYASGNVWPLVVGEDEEIEEWRYELFSAFIGSGDGTIQNCYASGTVDRLPNNFESHCEITNSYMLDIKGTSESPAARSYEELNQRSTYNGWDFTGVWSMTNDLPKLRWHEQWYEAEKASSLAYLADIGFPRDLLNNLDEETALQVYRGLVGQFIINSNVTSMSMRENDVNIQRFLTAQGVETELMQFLADPKPIETDHFYLDVGVTYVGTGIKDRTDYGYKIQFVQVIINWRWKEGRPYWKWQDAVTVNWQGQETVFKIDESSLTSRLRAVYRQPVGGANTYWSLESSNAAITNDSGLGCYIDLGKMTSVSSQMDRGNLEQPAGTIIFNLLPKDKCEAIYTHGAQKVENRTNEKSSINIETVYTHDEKWVSLDPSISISQSINGGVTVDTPLTYSQMKKIGTLLYTRESAIN